MSINQYLYRQHGGKLQSKKSNGTLIKHCFKWIYLFLVEWNIHYILDEAPTCIWVHAYFVSIIGWQDWVNFAWLIHDLQENDKNFRLSFLIECSPWALWTWSNKHSRLISMKGFFSLKMHLNLSSGLGFIRKAPFCLTLISQINVALAVPSKRQWLRMLVLMMAVMVWDD